MLKTYKMYRIFDLLFFKKEDAEKLEDGKDFAQERFIVSNEEPANGEYIEPNYNIFKTEEQANAFANSENSFEQEEEINSFMDHMQKSVFELMDTLETGDYEERFNVKISLNGKELSLPLHADLFSRLETLLKEEKEENAQ
jgi:hypothetical protein